MTDAREGSWLRRHVLYPEHYTWFVLVGVLDIVLTHQILFHFADFGGREMNTIADWFIQRFGLWGAIFLKFSAVLTVILVAEVVGRHRERTGRTLMTWAIVIGALPPAWALFLLLTFALGHR